VKGEPHNVAAEYFVVSK